MSCSVGTSLRTAGDEDEDGDGKDRTERMRRKDGSRARARAREERSSGTCEQWRDNHFNES